MVVLDTDHLTLLERGWGVGSQVLQDRLDRLDAGSRATTIVSYEVRIAAIVLTHEATLLTKNSSDFRKVPGLKVSDWTLPDGS